LVLDPDEDGWSTGGGYLYSQGSRAAGNPVIAEVIRHVGDLWRLYPALFEESGRDADTGPRR
jgi:hypothetical protein